MTWSIFMQIVELRTKIVSVSTLVLSGLSVYWIYGQMPWLLLFLQFLTVLAVDMGTTAFNTFFDFERGVDDTFTNQEPDKVLIRRGTPSGYALLAALALFAFAGVLGLFLALWKGWPLLALGLVSFFVAYKYSGGKTPLSATPWGEFFAGFFLGCVLWLVVAFTLAPPSVPTPAWQPEFWGRHLLASLPSFFFIASILTVNNACDREGDRASGRQTLSLLLGPPADLLIILLPLAAYLTQVALSLLGFLPIGMTLAALVGLALSIPLWRGMFESGFSHSTKARNMGAVSQSFIIYSLLSALGMLSGIVFR
jgi:1,4-dihydroxy-2-naphthoate octaprenyltransferase